MYFRFAHGPSGRCFYMPPLLPSLVQGYRLRPNLAFYCCLCRLCGDVWTRCGFLFGCCSTCHAARYSLLSGCLFLAVPLLACPWRLLLCSCRPALSLSISCALCTTAFDQVLVLYFWLLPRRFAMPPRLQGALLPYAASFLWYWFGDPAFGPPAIDCEPCHEVWPVRVLYFWLLPRRFAHGPSPSGHAASTTFSGTGIPPSAQLSTLRRALLPLPRCLDALRILFSCCSMALFLVTPAVWGYGLWPPSDRLRAAIGPFFVPAPAVNSWILIALARAAAALADSAS